MTWPMSDNGMPITSGGDPANRRQSGYRGWEFSHIRAALPAEPIQAQRFREAVPGYDVWVPSPGARLGYVPSYEPGKRMPWMGWDAWTSRDIAGRRSSGWGTYGLEAPWPEQLPDLRAERQRVNYLPNEVTRRISGSMDRVTSMQVAVPQDRPFLQLRATGGTLPNVGMHVRVTAGMIVGGAEQRREFFLGGGWTGTFALGEYDGVTIDILELSANTRLQWSWLEKTLEAGDQTLYLPQRTTGVGPFAEQLVPEGAYEVMVEVTDGAWQWNTALAGTQLLGVNAQDTGDGGVRNPVLGTSFIPAVQNQWVWAIRPI